MDNNHTETNEDVEPMIDKLDEAIRTTVYFSSPLDWERILDELQKTLHKGRGTMRQRIPKKRNSCRVSNRNYQKTYLSASFSPSQIITSVSMSSDCSCNFMDGKKASNCMNWAMKCWNGKLICAKIMYPSIRRSSPLFTPSGGGEYWKKWLDPSQCSPRKDTKRSRWNLGGKAQQLFTTYSLCH